MRRIIIGVLISMLVLSSCMGAFTTATSQKKEVESEPINADYSHAIYAEFFTMTTCVPCKYAHQALYQLYYEGWHSPYFYYITYVYNKNNISNMRKNELQVVGSPTTAFDGGYRELIGASDIEEEKTRFNNTILICAARNVYDIDLSLNVEWLGAVNNHPEDGETLVPIETIFNWTNSEMKIDVTAENNDASDYNGHIHIQITECNSSLWDDKFGFPYTFEFKNYALNEDMALDSGATFSETIYWDGIDYDDAGGDDWDPHIFDYLTQENTMVIATVYDKDNNKYLDETAGFLAGVDTDPKLFDVYFGDTNPPPKVISNGSAMKYNPPDLNWSTTYYWKVDVWNAKGELLEGDVWSFTTRGNVAPNIPMDLSPKNGTTEIPIDTNLSWLGGDPDGDTVTYDIYFGEFDPFEEPPLIESGWQETTYDPTPFGQTLDFDTKYYWKIVAWDEYGLNSSSEVWNFQTEINRPPNPASNPRPPDGTKNVPVNATLKWNGSDPNSGDRLTYDVYFGPNPDPPIVSVDQSDATYDPYGPTGDMPLHEDFYWRIVTRDREGLETDGPDWTFTTGLNPPPTDPEIDGPTQGGTDIVYDFTFVSTDPDGNQISYHVDWGDGTNSGWTPLYDNATVITLNHSWDTQKTYIIEAKARDEYGKDSDGVSEHEIIIPRSRAVSYNPILSWLFESFPHLFQLLRNLLGL